MIINKEIILEEMRKNSNSQIQNTIDETNKHIDNVQDLLQTIIKELQIRSNKHDMSKLEEPEFSTFVEYTPKLAASTYGSDEYKQFLKEMKPALDHHYSVNRHHPEHFQNGIDDMTLIDLIEMICDWKAATMRHNNGNIEKSIKINSDRFKISEQLTKILSNTAKLLGE